MTATNVLGLPVQDGKISVGDLATWIESRDAACADEELCKYLEHTSDSWFANRQDHEREPPGADIVRRWCREMLVAIRADGLGGCELCCS